MLAVLKRYKEWSCEWKGNGVKEIATALHGEYKTNAGNGGSLGAVPNLALRGLFALGQAGESLGVLGEGFGDDGVVNELAVAAALDQAGVGEDFEVVGNRGGGNAAQGDDFAAVHFFSGGNGFKNH